MAGKESKGGIGDWTVIIATLSLLFGAIYTNQDPDTPRPTPPLKGDITRPIQDAEARLWQDPFEAIARHRETNHKKEDCYRQEYINKAGDESFSPKILKDSSCGQSLEPELSLEDMGKIINSYSDIALLGVMVNGGPYVGAGESRRQTRYAVLSALKEEDYIPNDAEHLGHLSPKKDIKNVKDNEGFPEVVPFELLSLKGDLKNNVLVLWLNEEAFDAEHKSPDVNQTIGKHEPLQWLIKFFTKLQVKSSNKVTIKLIGPGESTTLLNMLGEEKQAKNNAPPNWQDLYYSINDLKLRIYSPRATIHNNSLDTFLISPPAPSYYPTVFNRIGPDDCALAKELKDELIKRQASDPRQLVLISQWDTIYARSLADNIKEVMVSDSKNPCADDREGDASENHGAITHYTFLRGLDGKLAGNPEKKTNPSSTNTPGVNTASVPAQGADDRAEGDSQIDYLRRIRDEMIQKDNNGGIRAVGLIANDYYDKLLILSVLKPKFPEAIFFTTDLDANMLNHSDDRYTRNLVVASAFGRTLNPQLQGSTPPFRSSLQTATYLAVRAAINNLSENELPETWQPNLYEIGRTKPVDLKPQKFEECTKTDLKSCRNIHNDENFPNIQSPEFSKFIIIAFIICLALILGTFPSAELNLICCKLTDKIKRHPLSAAVIINLEAISFVFISIEFWTLALIVGDISLAVIVTNFSFNIILILCKNLINRMESHCLSAVIALALVVVMFMMLNQENEESFFLAEGVSIWPSELIRGFATLLSIYFCCHITSSLRSSDHEIGRYFFSKVKEIQPKVGLCKSLERIIMAKNRLAKRRNRLLSDSIDVNGAWTKYTEENILRISVIQAFLFWIGCFAFVGAWGFPLAPARGGLAYQVDLLIMLISVFLFLLTLFYVRNAISRVTRLAQKLWWETKWDRTDLRRFGFPSGVTDTNGQKIGFENWLDIQLIARCTETVKPFIFYPIIILFLMIFARSRLFDSWSIPIPLLMVFGLSLVIAISAAMRLRWAAESTREHCIEYLNRYLMRARAEKGKGRRRGSDYDTLAAQLEKIIEEAKNLDKGAFSSFTQQAHVQAILAIIAALSSVKLIDYFQFG